MTVLLSFVYITLSQTSSSVSCKSHFDCNASSACCKNSVCVDRSQCDMDTKIYYLIVGSVGFFFILTTFIYFIYVISQSRKKIYKIKELVLTREKEIEELLNPRPVNKDNVKDINVVNNNINNNPNQSNNNINNHNHSNNHNNNVK